MGSELTPKFDQEALQRILQRAAELQADERDVSGSLDGNEVLALGRDVGIPERYLRQAMLEVGQAREAPEPEGWLDEMVGAASVHAERVVRGDPPAIEEALVRYLETEEVFGVIRRTEGQVIPFAFAGQEVVGALQSHFDTLLSGVAGHDVDSIQAAIQHAVDAYG